MQNSKFKIQKLILLFLVLGIFLSSVGSVLALTPKVTPTPLPTPTPTPEKVDYFLVYPGILPDHFLYSIKMIRDRILVFLTVDPLKKAELYLLFADKRLGAGKALIEGGKTDLGASTITKAEKYLEQAISQEKLARQGGKETKAFLEKLANATRKHEEILKELSLKATGGIKSTLESFMEYPRRGYEQVKQALGQ